ncbi:uncharacterized protein Yka (UPF0111/DUF47 family) [Bacillus sp. SLBN-46]|uniref:hypothetical protein n=1 Tax=Bacillus sp. SLBN-46 TaxID=3042283 RepID=UPI00285C2ECA|nr:hypothetical protein [Bacillus sp. SLBN-46]MDR6120621.1 uncharacterized protein Yka (UPF0111/DUF47 family) [Bacillus sp. SLBN-46]
MKNEKMIIEEIVKVNRNMVIGIHESLDKIDSDYGRRIAAIESKIFSIEKLLDSLGNELREQYYSIGRRLDILEVQIINRDEQ